MGVPGSLAAPGASMECPGPMVARLKGSDAGQDGRRLVVTGGHAASECEAVAKGLRDIVRSAE
jgi:hypothetical protein